MVMASRESDTVMASHTNDCPFYIQHMMVYWSSHIYTYTHMQQEVAISVNGGGDGDVRCALCLGVVTGVVPNAALMDLIEVKD